MLTDPARNAKVAQFKEVADDIDASLTQLALAWCVRNPNVSTVITGASTPEQVVENMSALDVVDRLTPEVLERLDIISLLG